MKAWDLLLEWMTHVGTGSWGAFRDAVAELSNEEIDEQSLLRTLRIALSDLGHVNFFVGGSRRWRVLRPALVELATDGMHLLAGGRTRGLLEQLVRSLERHAEVRVTDCIPGLSSVHVVGDSRSLATVASSIDIEYVADSSATLAARLPSIRNVLGTSRSVEEPINWSVRSWSFEERRWVGCALQRTVREYRNRHDVKRYIVHTGKSDLREIEKRASIYCAALLRREKIISYTPDAQQIRVPRWAPLPGNYARVACLCAGRLGALTNDEIVFQDVEPRVASMLLVGLGQGLLIPEARR
jgi:hypothetical protein